jgi:hypothetical protein
MVATTHLKAGDWRLDIFPEGDPSSSPGLLYSATLGKMGVPQPQRGCGEASSRKRMNSIIENHSRQTDPDWVRGEDWPQPRWGWELGRRLSQGSRVQQPWAGGRIPFGEIVQTLATHGRQHA